MGLRVGPVATLAKNPYARNNKIQEANEGKLWRVKRKAMEKITTIAATNLAA
jgi:hypothetical protein|tara:strand:- start:212 stop:367 length:156 start_codon:yes stop_codon:yes gene_type:complete